MIRKKNFLETEHELYALRFNSLGLELPETATANPAAMRSIAAFLLKYGLFEHDAETLRKLASGEEVPIIQTHDMDEDFG